MRRIDVVERVLTCTSCELAGLHGGPVPLSGPTPNYLAVVGRHPSLTDDAQGRPFVGEVGRLLHDCLADAGIPPGAPTYMNSVSCFVDGEPTRGHVNACSANLAAQLELTNPVWVLVLGGVALSAWRPDLTNISRVHRHVLLHPDRRWQCFVTFDPTAASRNKKTEVMLRADLKVLAAMMDTDAWQALADDSCVHCGTDPETLGEHDEHIRVDGWNVPYCSSCWQFSPPGRAEAREARAVDRHQVRTGSLFP